ncbi:hypothetical protein XHC_2792 [Xanthomonas hortorum pv. carotae str. M081]|nr:hypothetical protein XHC_2792 [Xanthomonas hortorum pv. carotae str. M081]
MRSGNAFNAEVSLDKARSITWLALADSIDRTLRIAFKRRRPWRG